MNVAAVLVGIVTRNRAGILPRALASAFAQSAPNLQVAVIDDGSTDETPKLPAQFPEVSWVRRETGQGYMSARNELMARPGCDFYVSLDDDAWFLRNDEIAVALQYLTEHPSVAAVAFDILAPDQPGAHKADLSALATMELVNRHYVMTQVLRRDRWRDFLRLFVWEAFQMAVCAARAESRQNLPAVCRGKWRAVQHIRTGII